MQTCGVGGNGGGIWTWFHMTDCRGGPRCQTIQSALESGTQTIDNKITMPDEVVCEGLVYEDDYASLEELDRMVESKSLDALCSVTSRDAVYTDMLVLKHDTVSVPDNYEYVKCIITLQQVFFDDSDPNGDNSISR